MRESGGKLGPDLSQIGQKYKRHELLETLLKPSKTIDPKFAAHMLLTTDGRLLTGILAEQSAEQVVLQVFTSGKAEEVRIPAGDVDELLPQMTSLMPEGLLRDLTPQQAADLIEFLWSLK